MWMLITALRAVLIDMFNSEKKRNRTLNDKELVGMRRAMLLSSY